MSKSVLVLDGNMRSALAATRSLGKKKIRVIVGDETDTTLAASSKFCSERLQYPSPFHDSAAFVDALVGECRTRSVDVLYPMTDISMYHVLKNRNRFTSVVIPYGSFEAYEQLTDKWKFFKLAQQLGLPIPTTHFVDAASELSHLAGELKFPLVIKPYRSRLLSSGVWLKTTVKYANTFEELLRVVSEYPYLADHPFLLQEYIHGVNQGVFALCSQGTPLVFFANKRTRDKPPSGGVATLAESIAVEPAGRSVTETLLSHVGWHGVAMVECKVRNGIPYLMEVNARFWATTQLAVDSGVDFPWLLYQIATGLKPDEVRSHKVGQRLRWLIGDFIHLYMNAAGKGLNRHESTQERQQALAGFWNFFERNTKFEINRWDDLGPFLYEIKRYCRFSRKTTAKAGVDSLADTLEKAV
jgi:predicted ATP-grasp superfamily ATP-dependent carboligase